MIFRTASGVALGSAFGSIAQAAVAPIGLAVAAPAAYALVGVAAMLAANCQVGALLTRDSLHVLCIANLTGLYV